MHTNEVKRAWTRRLAPLLALICLAAPLPAAAADDAGMAGMTSNETVFSRSLRFTGEVVEVLPSGKAIRQVAIHRGRAFTWRGKLGTRVATAERVQVETAPVEDLDTISVEELARNLRGQMLFAGHEFIEAEPAYDVARLAKLHHQLQREGASAQELDKLLPPTSPSVGSAGLKAGAVARTTKLPGRLVPFTVHGTDDRDVIDNMGYPHRAQLVFDNVGTLIDGSQGSGTLIGPSTALSVAHVFWDEVNGTWEADHDWAPGFDNQDADASPWGQFGCYLVTIPSGYTTNINQNTYDYAVLDFDVGCNIVRNGVNSDAPGSTVGWLGTWVAGDSDIESNTGYVRGYPGIGTCGNPGVSCNVRVWGDTSSPNENNATSSTIEHQADTSSGNSGSGFYVYDDPSCGGCDYGPYVVGLHRAGSASYNLARRYTSTVSSFMHANSSDY